MALIADIKQQVNDYLDSQYIGRLREQVELVYREMKELSGWTDQELRLASTAFKDDLKKGKPLDELVVPSFAVVAESARRLLGQVPYDVQVLGGMIIHKGKVAEMKAGEGKTLTETMPVYLNALEGKGVHIVTTNDYLAERDAKWMGKLYGFLGLTVGYVTSGMENDERRKAYASDVTYVSNQEVGFDFLRDNLVFARSDRVLRPEHPLRFGIVDEIDSILIDESRTPLIIAEPGGEEQSHYDVFTELVAKLKEDEDFTVDYKNKNITVTDRGLDRVEQTLGTRVFSKSNPMFVFYLDVCLKARVLFERDRDYIVTKEGIEIVDEFTGRVLPGRRFTDGVHQAIEAKEHAKVKGADKTTAAITFQNFFPMYEKLSGMSGTVMAARDEFAQVYKLEVIQVPTHKPIAREDHSDLFFKTRAGKFRWLVKKARQLYQRGQPLLLGTRNVETAHEVSELLNEANLPHQLLTAADNRAEAEKVAKAGQEGMVTVATNMAGRGTDILLGAGVKELGGLYVIGTERHESRRIDNQLVGRSGRQGEVGESVFLISMEDEIMQLFGSERIIDVMEQYDIPEDEFISGPSLDAAFKKAQDFVESRNYDSRIYLYKYDRVTNAQRTEMYELRDALLENELSFREFYLRSVKDTLSESFSLGGVEEITRDIQAVFSIRVEPDEFAQAVRTETGLDRDSLLLVQAKFESYLLKAAERLFKRAELYDAAQHLVLKVIDDAWSRHLELMDVLKQEANLFSYASEDPLLDFIKDSRRLFADLGRDIQRQFISSVFKVLNQEGMLK